MNNQYNFKKVEQDVQKLWDAKESFKAVEDDAREKYYCLAMFPYPSGNLHMGHVRNYTIGDVIARFQRALGKNVLQPMGWDAFGLPAENAAVKNGVPAASWTRSNIGYMRDQLKSLGFSYDWRRELATCDESYFRWEQWMFCRLFEQGLVYKKNSAVNWCPNDETVLANEQVVNGLCWRCDTPVEKKEISQWFMKITQYADELLSDLEKLDDWPQQVKTMQANWIGRSEGLEIDFVVEGTDDVIKVYTTRPDTLMGVTYLAVAAEHPIAARCAREDLSVEQFIETCQQVSTSNADLETIEKKGVPLGLNVIHPVTGEKIPLWAANFVLMSYGTGAVMSVPAHDQRDYEFALKHGLGVRQVVFPFEGREWDIQKSAFTEKGLLKNSDEFDGLDSVAAFDVIAKTLTEKGKGKKRTNYRLRDWGVSRQRYWGTPIPIINCERCGCVPVPDSDLPVTLPKSTDRETIGLPLKDDPEFIKTKCPCCNSDARRETDTFDTFMESSWYYARFASVDNNENMLDKRANYWLPVDQYVGGIEHAILHLLYARFYHKLLRDAGLVSSDEPFKKLLTQGMVLKDGFKMSKSKGNVVDPQYLVDTYGADTVRLFVMFAAPPEQSLEWSDAGVEGAFRFIKKLWRFVATHLEERDFSSVDSADNEQKRKVIRRRVHETIKKVSDDYLRRLTFNTAIASIMELINDMQKFECKNNQDYEVVREGVEASVLMLNPITPHICSRLWVELGHENGLGNGCWPQFDEAALKKDEIEMVVQVNGKLRGRITVPISASREEIETQASNVDNVIPFLQGKDIRKKIVVPGRLVNIVTS